MPDSCIPPDSYLEEFFRDITDKQIIKWSNNGVCESDTRDRKRLADAELRRRDRNQPI